MEFLTIVLILAFDTSAFAGSVAVLDGPQTLAEVTLDAARRSAQTLAPAIAELLKSRGIAPADIKLVATTIGPGSFTGLRVGITTAKAFAYAVEAEVIGVSTLEAIAGRIPAATVAGHSRGIHAVLDAQRKELFVGRFRAEATVAVSPDVLGGLVYPRVAADIIMSEEAWLASLPPDAIVTGTGLARLLPRLPATVTVAPRELWEPRAADVGKVALAYHACGQRDDLWKLAPVYLRPSYAEEAKASR